MLVVFRRDDVAKDAAFVTGIIQVRDGAVRLIWVGNVCGLKLLDHLGINSTSNGTAAFSAATSRAVFSGLSSISGIPSPIELRDSTITNDREYGSTEPFSRRKNLFLTLANGCWRRGSDHRS